jgi:hypothetical protein
VKWLLEKRPQRRLVVKRPPRKPQRRRSSCGSSRTFTKEPATWPALLFSPGATSPSESGGFRRAVSRRRRRTPDVGAEARLFLLARSARNDYPHRLVGFNSLLTGARHRQFSIHCHVGLNLFRLGRHRVGRSQPVLPRRGKVSGAQKALSVPPSAIGRNMLKLATLRPGAIPARRRSVAV